MKQIKPIRLLYLSLFIINLNLSYAQAEIEEYPQPKKTTLNILNWQAYIDPYLIRTFTQKTGIEVNIDDFQTSKERAIKLANPKSQYDLVVADASFIAEMVEKDLIQPINFKKIPNEKYRSQELNNKLKQIPKVNQYSINYTWGTLGLAYTNQLIKSRLIRGINSNSLALLFDPKSAARFQDCGIGFIDDPEEIIASTLTYLHMVPDSSNLREIREAGRALMRIKPYVRAIYGSGATLPFHNNAASFDPKKQEGICIGLAWSSDIASQRALSVRAYEPFDVSFVSPKEGNLIWFDQFVIMKDSSKQEEALQFLNHYMEPRINAHSQIYLYSASNNEGAYKYLPQKVIDEYHIQDFKNAYLRRPYSKEALAEIQKIWDEFTDGLEYY